MAHLRALLCVAFIIVSTGLRFQEMDKCGYVGSYGPGQTPLTLEWSYNSSYLHGRIISSSTRAGVAARDGFVGVGLLGDGHANPVGHPNLLAGWPALDTGCIEMLYMNYTDSWHGYCIEDNTTLAIPNCTYAAHTGYNGTCRNDTAAINMKCYCECSLDQGCYGPDPSCVDCKDGCNRCKAGFGGSTCRIPIASDIYQPDGANTFIRIAWKRDIANFPHGYTPGLPDPVEVVWAYRQSSLFNTTQSTCAEGVIGNLHRDSPYTMVNRDTERVQLRIDWASNEYLRLPNGRCKDLPLYHISGKPILHVRKEQGSPTIGTGWLTNLLKLGAGYEDHIRVPAGSTLDTGTSLVSEASVSPEPGVGVILSGGTTSPLVWTAQQTVSGVWANYTTGSPFVHYWSVALYSSTALSTVAQFRHGGAIRAWVNGFLIYSSTSGDNGVEQSATAFTFPAGWNVMMFKVYGSATGPNHFSVKLDSGASLLWKHSFLSTGDGATLGTSAIEDLLHLGASSTDCVVVSGVSAMSTNYLNPTETEVGLQPMENDQVKCPSGTSSPLVWKPYYRSDGIWGFGSFDNFVQYFALAIYSPSNQLVVATYRNDDAVKVWLDGSVIISRDVWDGNVDQTSPVFNVSTGWHQMLVKIFDQTGTNQFRIKLDKGANLRWSYQLPFKCSPNPCQNGGSCLNSQCFCTEGHNGEFCETGYLWGEQFQNTRAVIFNMQ
eukprot:NODE_505_length_2393_cov_76.998238_g479_i0.p1 GENE.NODE_505_length_2393_cov_76.998238_g479_i0~~NODE_505_length_2393_cov_76.998238_g479_i0.p1  ORF type:complete len:715 (-),score=101.32 NODE_505_length_2393_cov_76.998238_g479_i0:182-2326(-)